MGLLDNAKDLATLAIEVGKMDLYQKAVDLQAQLVELSDQNAELRAKLAAIDERKRIGALLTPHGDAYWKREDGKVDGPFCTNCWDGEGLLMRLLKAGANFPWPTCPRCKVKLVAHTPRPPAQGEAPVSAAEKIGPKVIVRQRRR